MKVAHKGDENDERRTTATAHTFHGYNCHKHVGCHEGHRWVTWVYMLVQRQPPVGHVSIHVSAPTATGVSREYTC
jgi:hypothetical protein